MSIEDPHAPAVSADGLEAKTRRAFAASVARVDGSTRSSLAQARAEAVAAAAGGPQGRTLHRGFGVAGIAAAMALTAAVVWLQQPVPDTAVGLTAFDDLDILLDEEELELYEDLEFYTWLQEQPEFAEIVDDGSG